MHTALEDRLLIEGFTVTVPDPESGKEGKAQNRAALRHEQWCTFYSPFLSLFLVSSGFPVHAYLKKDSSNLQGDGEVVSQRQSTSLAYPKFQFQRHKQSCTEVFAEQSSISER